MPTLAELQAERWWGREIVTPAMDWLGDVLCAHYDRPRVAAGTKGDQYHLRGSHRSQEWILRSAYCTNRIYTVQPGLSETQARWVAGFDFTPGSAEQMIAQCKRLNTALRLGTLEEVREFYGNVDGDRIVDGWNNVANRAATSDSSHLWHWHISIDRRLCDQTDVMRHIFAVVTGQPMSAVPSTDGGENMLGFVRSNDPALPQVYLGDGITRRPVDEQDITDIRYLVKEGWLGPLANGGEIRAAANVDAFGALAEPAKLSDEQVEKIAAQLIAAADNPLGEADQPAIVAALKQALREGAEG